VAAGELRPRLNGKERNSGPSIPYAAPDTTILTAMASIYMPGAPGLAVWGCYETRWNTVPVGQTLPEPCSGGIGKPGTAVPGSTRY